MQIFVCIVVYFLQCLKITATKEWNSPAEAGFWKNSVCKSCRHRFFGWASQSRWDTGTIARNHTVAEALSYGVGDIWRQMKPAQAVRS